MNKEHNPFEPYSGCVVTQDGVFSEAEVGLANRNSGLLLETLALDITPTGAHYLLNHFDVPLIDEGAHSLSFNGSFNTPFNLTMAEIKALPKITMPVTLECAGNGRAGVSPRSYSMPWMYEAVGTSEWTGTPLAPLIGKAKPSADVVEISFHGADYGFDKGCGHFFGRSLTLAQMKELDVLLVYAMNDAPLLPQHGAPLRIVVPGWYGMASVKWLTEITALTNPYDGFQQVRTYQYRESDEDPGRPITTMRIKSLMVPPGVPDWTSRKRYVNTGPTELVGRAWSGAGTPIEKVEVEVSGVWHPANLENSEDRYAWKKWTFDWDATPGAHVLRCRATDAEGNVQPLEPPWDVAGFANNAVQVVHVFVE
ncbi:sulfite oxidase [Pseudohalocynthiibacter aestuariivivens]|jgi:DMSO/TMAO reductase YedYZ molybdopterin-dependent catalytic subunit|uniref:Sulfite oxidase n=1 Tax=Pseudohalocynthiibacter aestuariivivens TaxID=1591409 RepID=A0ABV5JAY1_9RHOB|nr:MULTISPECIES: sulfite oxidase [Pseudohalocynthiibacter]MBS9715851.1 sulfite oxidase [Pseudohalocynthiibacter aestuariivivens]MCK0101464.1 sulfite oxidase [Pseudohalocynthiibacter sp. F2068]